MKRLSKTQFAYASPVGLTGRGYAVFRGRNPDVYPVMTCDLPHNFHKFGKRIEKVGDRSGGHR